MPGRRLLRHMLTHFDPKRETCSFCGLARATKHIYHPIDVVACNNCFAEYLRQMPEGAEIIQTTIDNRPTLPFKEN